MEVSQVYSFVNSATSETIGNSVVLAEDLSNIVDVGEAIFNANAFDKYVKSLVNRIGRTIFVNRPYSGSAPSVLMDSWEYGSVCMKIASEMPVAQENESWSLTDGTSYDPNVFHQPVVEAKFFNKMITFEIDRSITERQVKQSFSSPIELNAFISMLYNEVDKSLTVKMDSLIMRTINNMIAETVHDAFSGEAITGVGNARAVNLLAKYNSSFGKTLTADKAIFDPEFIRYASFEMGRVSKRMTKMSTLFNVGKKARFTPENLLHVVMLSDFVSAASTYLYSDTFHENYLKLATAEQVPFWQGSGTDYSFGEISKVNVTKTASGNAQVVSGVLCVMFDRDALGVTNLDTRVTTNYNAKAEFTNYFFKRDARYFNDFNENFVVFYVA